MKKLIVLAAVAVAASFANAASLDWKIVAGDGNTGLSFIITESVNPLWTSAADIVAYGTGGNTGTTAQKGQAGRGGYVGATGTVIGIPATEAGQNQTVYAIILSADGKGYWAEDMTGYVYTTESTHAQALADMATTLAGNYTEWYSEEPPTPPTPPIPEPTSGLLLLLGVAGMALRRRRA